MQHYSLWDLRVFEGEFLRFSPLHLAEIRREGHTFFLVFRNQHYAVKFHSTFPGYRLVHVPESSLSGGEVLTDLVPAKVLSAKVLNNDRIFGIWLRNSNFDFAVIFELLASLSNFLVINSEGKVLYTGRRIRDKRGLRPGALYELPEKHTFEKLQRVFENLGALDPGLIEKGYFCRGEEQNCWSPVKLADASCIEYYPYTYAIEMYYETLESPGQKAPDENILRKYIDIIQSSFTGDYVFDSDEIEVNSFKVPVSKGVKVSKLVGEWRAQLLARESRKVIKRKRESSILEFESPSGKTVLVGRSAEANHRLTFNLARKHDYIFHVRDYPGSHVILFTQGSEPSPEDVNFCARLALKYSKAGGGKIEVLYAPVSRVFRRIGMPKGLVMFRTYETVLVEK